MDDIRLGRVVRPRSVDQVDGVRGGDDDGDVDGGASRSVGRRRVSIDGRADEEARHR
jgi:hypothetical protein